MRAFFTNLLAICNIHVHVAKPVKATECEFCGGVKCFGACGAEGVFNKAQDFCGRLVSHEGNESCFVCDDGKQVHFRLGSHIARDILSACPDGERCRITVVVDKGTITALFSAERLEPVAASLAASQQAI